MLSDQHGTFSTFRELCKHESITTTMNKSVSVRFNIKKIKMVFGVGANMLKMSFFEYKKEPG